MQSLPSRGGEKEIIRDMLSGRQLLNQALFVSLISVAMSGQVPEKIKQGHSHVSEAFDTDHARSHGK